MPGDEKRNPGKSGRQEKRPVQRIESLQFFLTSDFTTK